MSELNQLEILEKIGQGGMGDVYKAKLMGAHGFEKIVAVKKVKKSFIKSDTDKSAEDTLINSLKNEAMLMSKMQHKNIAQVFNLIEDEEELSLVMEYIEGVSLKEVLDLAIEKEFNLSQEFIVSILYQCLEALNYAHTAFDRPIIHRDISPHNIMITKSGEIKLIDFGLGKSISKIHEISMTENYSGKVSYRLWQ